MWLYCCPSCVFCSSFLMNVCMRVCIGVCGAPFVCSIPTEVGRSVSSLRLHGLFTFFLLQFIRFATIFNAGQMYSQNTKWFNLKWLRQIDMGRCLLQNMKIIYNIVENCEWLSKRTSGLLLFCLLVCWASMGTLFVLE